MDNKEDFVKLMELLAKYIYNLSEEEMSEYTISNEYEDIIREQKDCANKIMSRCIIMFKDKSDNHESSEDIIKLVGGAN